MQHAALDHVLELAHVAGPEMRSSACRADRSKPLDAACVLRTAARQEVRGERRDVLAAFAQRRQLNLDGVEAVQQVLAEAALGDFSPARSAFVAESTRTFDASRATIRRAGTRRSAARAGASACCASGMLAISSRNSVPPSASSKQPMRSVRASVNAPLTWPKSSLSSTPSDSPPALTATNGLRRRASTAACSRLATTSLPVPCSPVMSTFASDGATRSIELAAPASSPATSAMNVGSSRALQPRVLVLAAAGCARSARAQLELRRAASRPAARCPTASGCSRARRAASPRPRRSTLPHAVITTTGSVGSSSRIRASRSKPSWPDVVSRV